VVPWCSGTSAANLTLTVAWGHFKNTDGSYGDAAAVQSCLNCSVANISSPVGACVFLNQSFPGSFGFDGAYRLFFRDNGDDKCTSAYSTTNTVCNATYPLGAKYGVLTCANCADCFDGVLSPLELGVDCGGVCPTACPEPPLSSLATVDEIGINQVSGVGFIEYVPYFDTYYDDGRPYDSDLVLYNYSKPTTSPYFYSYWNDFILSFAHPFGSAPSFSIVVDMALHLPLTSADTSYAVLSVSGKASDAVLYVGGLDSVGLLTSCTKATGCQVGFNGVLLDVRIRDFVLSRWIVVVDGAANTTSLYIDGAQWYNARGTLSLGSDLLTFPNVDMPKLSSIAGEVTGLAIWKHAFNDTERRSLSLVMTDIVQRRQTATMAAVIPAPVLEVLNASLVGQWAASVSGCSDAYSQRGWPRSGSLYLNRLYSCAQLLGAQNCTYTSGTEADCVAAWAPLADSCGLTNRTCVHTMQVGFGTMINIVQLNIYAPDVPVFVGSIEALSAVSGVFVQVSSGDASTGRLFSVPNHIQTYPLAPAVTDTLRLTLYSLTNDEEVDALFLIGTLPALTAAPTPLLTTALPTAPLSTHMPSPVSTVPVPATAMTTTTTTHSQTMQPTTTTTTTTYYYYTSTLLSSSQANEPTLSSSSSSPTTEVLPTTTIPQTAATTSVLAGTTRAVAVVTMRSNSGLSSGLIAVIVVLPLA
jgi:hypothetical protein